MEIEEGSQCFRCVRDRECFPLCYPSVTDLQSDSQMLKIEPSRKVGDPTILMLPVVPLPTSNDLVQD